MTQWLLRQPDGDVALATIRQVEHDLASGLAREQLVMQIDDLLMGVKILGFIPPERVYPDHQALLERLMPQVFSRGGGFTDDAFCLCAGLARTETCLSQPGVLVVALFRALILRDLLTKLSRPL